MRFSRLVIFAILLACGTAHPALARAQSTEPPRPRAGYYVAFGLSGGAHRIAQDDRSDELALGLANALRFGQMVTPHFGLGLRLDFGGGQAGERQASSVALAIEAQWEVATHLALLASIGPAVVALSNADDPAEDQDATYGAAYALGVSYDFFIGVGQRSGGFALSPALGFRFVPGEEVSALSVVLGIEFTYFTGLPRDQLELPEDEAYRPR
jgi:hypothetical protein